MKAKYAVLSALIGMTGLGTARADSDTSVEEAWIMGKLEATYALNPYLSAFAIARTSRMASSR